MPPGEVIELRPQNPVNYDEAGTHFTRNPDGSEVVSLFGPQADTPDWERMAMAGAGTFGENLAENMSPGARHHLAQMLCEYERVDLESRKDWEDLVQASMELLGLKHVDASHLPFAGAAAMQHPILAECITQFSSNAIQEFFPATGPVKGDPLGDVTEAAEDAAERAAGYMNHYLTVEDVGYYADKDQMMFYLPVAGSAFVKGWQDPRSQLPQARYVKAEDFIAPYFAKDLENCPRYAHRFQMEGSEIKRAMANGEFVDISLPKPGTEMHNAETTMEDLSDRRTQVLHPDDELFQILEYHVDLLLDADELSDGQTHMPYIVTVDKSSQEILCVRRNWKQNDPKRKKRIWFAHYKFLPGMGFYGWGFMHIIGSLAQAISGSGRAILDSALLATVTGGFRAKDGIKRGGSIAIQPGRWQDVDATIDELSKTFYTPPVKEPVPALVNFFTTMVQDARRFASLTEVLVGQADNKAPVGTTLALIEQSMKLFTAVHKRIFAAAREEFRMLRELIFDFGPDQVYPYNVSGQGAQQALKQDFAATTLFAPVADPNIISDVQRISQAQAVLEMIDKAPDLYGPEQKIEAHSRLLKALKVPDWQKIAPQPPAGATYLDPVGENQMMMVGRPVKAFPGQRHDAHLQVHQWQIEQARLTLPPDQFQHIYLSIASHMREHQALAMSESISQQMMQAHGAPLPPVDIYGQNSNEDPHVEMAVAILAAQHLPPLPQPMPGSAAAMANGQQAPDPTAQAQEDVQKAQADIQNKGMETEAGIQRDTKKFVATYHQREQEHAQKLRHAEEDHRAKLAAMDKETSARILQAHAQHQQQQQQDRVQHLSALSHGKDTHQQSLKQTRRSANESLLATRQKRRASPGARKSPTRAA